jgi:MYXO-CTERM domain-containing protein
MRTIRTALAVSALVALPAAATAGPIGWSYSSTGVSDGQYRVDPASIPFTTPPGQSQNIYLIGGWQVPLFASPPPPQGPTLWTGVTITDANSGRSGTFSVPIEFTDPGPSQVSGWFQYTPHLGPIGRIDLSLGGNDYDVTNGPDRALTVQVVPTPEPTPLVMAAVGLAGLGLARRRQRNALK